MDPIARLITSLLVYIGVYAYGESRFEITFNPCQANIKSLCPAQSNVTIDAAGYIPLAPSDISDIPNIAYSIPDFEGQLVIRFFANSTQSEIGCYAGVVTNGASFAQPAAVGSVLGIFTFVAMLASFATAIYGTNVLEMRTHYAHSLSVGVVFAVWQHIYFTGALSMNWPSVLVAWWSNFAWAAGMIDTASMQNSIARLVGKNKGNTVTLGAAATGTDASSNVGGGFDIHTIYKRLETSDIVRDLHSPAFEERLFKRELANSSTGFKWYGQHVRDGLPLPGNFSGFAGTLAQLDIPASNAFLTGLIWLLILIVIITGSIVGFKFILDQLIKRKRVTTTRLEYFRSHWQTYLVLALLRTLYIAFFAMMFLSIFQISYDRSIGPTVIAAVICAVFLVCIPAVVWHAYKYRRHQLALMAGAAQPNEEPTKEDLEKKETKPDLVVDESHEDELAQSIHRDEDYTKKFGWLAARFRRTKWWFFTVWLAYELVRAVILAGASSFGIVQVFLLLALEVVAFLGVLRIRPFEGQRLNVIVVYLLGFSKVMTVALSAAFDSKFNLPRIITTAIGIIILVIQGLLVVAVLIAIALSAISSYMSITRNREEFKPKKWAPYRVKYFAHLEQAVTDLPPPPPPPPTEPEEPKPPYFSVNTVKRMTKIEDDDVDFQADIVADPRASQVSMAGPSAYEPRTRTSRALSAGSHSSLPYGARVHRGSWSTKDFADHFDLENSQPKEFNTTNAAGDGYRPISLRKHASSESFQSQRVYSIQPTRSSSMRARNSAAALGSSSVNRSSSGMDLNGKMAATSVPEEGIPADSLARSETPVSLPAASPFQNLHLNEGARASPLARTRPSVRHRPRESIHEEELELNDSKPENP